ncbi:hypothetical protein MGYG_01439 [Nannizzia gypsea CBS 118893]|uniref:Uncharacterized protein n=1 Tax=Arthroderma gypseum (strain ATCC MYA-4604 / CBS 118893) TaxID=535722 RepID=E5R0W7_ARTGP|nr:hypothetical protein MGYG_01439 [Nannizzia gypsea CBS 118893]EFQ98409.1 hypothetical protein MGYG_01439 [Nannizzia gypsea CBS 118893]
MFPTRGQGLATPERTSSSSTSPFRPQPPRIDTNVPHITVNGKEVEVIEISSGPSPQDTNPESTQITPALGIAQRQLVQQPLRTQSGSPSPFAATPAGNPQGPHTIFKPIKIHTAKCDVCNKHNKATLQRCIDCGWQICTPCWNARGGNGAHGSVRKFTGAIYRSSEDELPLKKPRKKGKNVNNEAKDTLAGKEKPSAKDIGSTSTRSGPEVGKGRSPLVVLRHSTVSADSSPGQVPKAAKTSRVVLQKAQGNFKIRASSGQASVRPASSRSDVPRRASVGSSQTPRTTNNAQQAIVDDLSSSSFLTSLSALEEDCGYRGDEDNEDEDDEDDDATEIDPENEDVLVADGKAYQKRIFRDLNPEVETRMNWLLIAAEQALKVREREQDQERSNGGSKGGSKGRNAVPKTPEPPTRPSEPPARSWVLTPSQHSSPAPAAAPRTVSAPVSVPVSAPPVSAPTQALASAPYIAPVPVSFYFQSDPPAPPEMLEAPKRPVFARPLGRVRSLAAPAVPVSELIPRPDPMDIDQPRSVSNPPVTSRPPRKPLHQPDVPRGLRGILPGTHTFRNSAAGASHQRQMRLFEALREKRLKEEQERKQREQHEAAERAAKPHARAWEL